MSGCVVGKNTGIQEMAPFLLLIIYEFSQHRLVGLVKPFV